MAEAPDNFVFLSKEHLIAKKLNHLIPFRS